MLTAQYVSMGVILIAIAVETWWAVTHKDNWLIAVPNLAWLVHSLLYYTYWWITNPADTKWIIEWGAALRLQGYLTVVMMGLYRMNGRFTKWIRR